MRIIERRRARTWAAGGDNSSNRARRGRASFVGLTSLPKDPLSSLQHEIRQCLALAYRGHALQLDDLLLALHLDLFCAVDLGLVLRLQLFHPVFQALHVWMVIDVVVRRVVTRRDGRCRIQFIVARRVSRGAL